MKKITFLLPLLLLPFFVACTSVTSQKDPTAHLLTVKDHSTVPMQLADQTFQFEVVNSDQSTAQGLSNRTEIGSDGLFFVFPQKGYQRFWMKEMLFDLDLIWLSDMQVVDISPNVPKPLQPNQQLPVYTPKKPVNAVLEVPAGTAQKWQVKIGDTFRYSW